MRPVLVAAIAALVACVGDDPSLGSSSGTSADGNLFDNGDFERGCTSSTGVFASVVDEEGASHAGKKSCRVCATAAGPYRFLGLVAIDGRAGDRYSLRAFTQQLSGVPAGEGLLVSLDGLNADIKDVEGEPDVLPNEGVRPSWTEVRGGFTVKTADTKRLSIVIGPNRAAVGDCFLIDDIVVKREN